MIRSHIDSTQECGVVLKLKRLFRLSSRSFGLGSPIGLEALSHPFSNLFIFLSLLYKAERILHFFHACLSFILSIREGSSRGVIESSHSVKFELNSIKIFFETIRQSFNQLKN